MELVLLLLGAALGAILSFAISRHFYERGSEETPTWYSEEWRRLLLKIADLLPQPDKEILRKAVQEIYGSPGYQKGLDPLIRMTHALGVIHLGLLIIELLRIRGREITDTRDEGERGIAVATLFAHDTIAFVSREIKTCAERVVAEIATAKGSTEVPEAIRFKERLGKLVRWSENIEGLLVTQTTRLPSEAEALSTAPPL